MAVLDPGLMQLLVLFFKKFCFIIQFLRRVLLKTLALFPLLQLTIAMPSTLLQNLVDTSCPVAM
jgi:hypothetical protein